RRARDLAQPGAGAPPGRVEPGPRTKSSLERLGGQFLRGRAVAGQVDEIAVDVVQMLLGNRGKPGHVVNTPPGALSSHLGFPRVGLSRLRSRARGGRWGIPKYTRVPISIGVMSDYTIVNLRDTEDHAPKFGF